LIPSSNMAACLARLGRHSGRRLRWSLQLRPCHAGNDGTLQKPASKQGASARGLQLKSKLDLYECSTDLNAAAEAAFKKCQMAAGMGTLGFAGVIVAASNNASLPMLAGLGCIAVANTYIILETPRRAMRGVAMKQVERLTLLPNTDAKDVDSRAEGSAAERLAATEKLELEIQSPNLIRRIRLDPPPAAWQGTRYSGLAVDSRRTFQDACRRLHVDPEGACSDKDLLDALLSSGNVVAEEPIEIRSDIEGHLRLPLDGKTPEGASLKEALPPDMEQYEPPEFARSTPLSAIESTGTRSMYMGMALMTLGAAGFSKYMVKSQAASDGSCARRF